MSVDPVQLFFGIAGLLLELTILYFGIREGLLRRMPAFYLYVVWAIIRNLGLWSYLLVIGVTPENHASFVSASYLSGFVSHALELVLLLRFYSIFKSREDKGVWLAFAGFTLLMTSFFSLHQLDTFNQMETWGAVGYYRVAQVTLLHFQTLFVALVLGHIIFNRYLSIGWNHVAIIFGLAISIVIEYLCWALYVSGVINYGIMRALLQPSVITPWIIWAISIRRHSPTLRLSESQIHSVTRNDREFERAVKSLLQR